MCPRIWRVPHSYEFMCLRNREVIYSYGFMCLRNREVVYSHGFMCPRFWRYLYSYGLMCLRKKYALFPYEFMRCRNRGHINSCILGKPQNYHLLFFPVFIRGFSVHVLFIEELLASSKGGEYCKDIYNEGDVCEEH